MIFDENRFVEAFNLLYEGRESIRSLAKRLGIPKSTLHRLYLKWINRKVDENLKTLNIFENEVSALLKKRSVLENEIRQVEKIKEFLL